MPNLILNLYFPNVWYTFRINHLKGKIRRLLLIFLLSFTELWISTCFGVQSKEELFIDKCEQNVTVKHTYTKDKQHVCKAVKRVNNFLEEFNIYIDSEFTIEVRDQVFTQIHDSGNSIKYIEVIGAYFPQEDTVKITRWGKFLMKNERYLFLPITEDLHISYITHEITHRYLRVLYNRMGREKPDRAADEYIAYIVQIATLTDATKNVLLSMDAWKGNVDGWEYGINTFVWQGNPDIFAIMSYKHFLIDKDVFHRIINGSFVSRDTLFNF